MPLQFDSAMTVVLANGNEHLFELQATIPIEGGPRDQGIDIGSAAAAAVEHAIATPGLNLGYEEIVEVTVRLSDFIWNPE